MKNLFIFCFMLLTSCVMATAQTKLTAVEQQMIIKKVESASQTMKSMQCDFTQTKTMKLLKKDMQSKGVMFFQRPDRLRWQYIAPYDYTFILDGDKVHLRSQRSSQQINVQQNKVFRQITSIILNSITAGSLKSNADFSVELYKQDTSYYARLLPKKKELKQIYRWIEIYFNPRLTMVSSVKMLEKTGDVTTVKLQNVKTNIKIDAQQFKVN